MTLVKLRYGAPAPVMPPVKENAWNVVIEYFHLFRHGIQSKSEDSTKQIDFLRSTMILDVMFNARYGVEAIVSNWRSLSALFGDLEVKIEGVQKTSRGSLVATTTTSFKTTEQTLRNVFPQLVRKDDNHNSVNSQVVDKLLGERIIMQGSVQVQAIASHQNGCASYPAVNTAGEASGGLKPTGGTSDCVDPPLGSQVYARATCDYEKQAPPPEHAIIDSNIMLYHSLGVFGLPFLQETIIRVESQDLIMWNQLTDEAPSALSTTDFGKTNVPFINNDFETKLEKAWPF
ncbi:unnamed protein product [Phytophthora lilii]|uniref:Unnamed protein product n=1 Tax=Phytophthora lilii TaxID=2077276 RepID=A0A9W6U887_9STRA|nr:unnamed protein product [Phytophthora lilii]